MLDLQKWNLATAQLRGFSQNLPTGPSEDDVAHYHSIVELLERASGHDLSIFKVSLERLKPRVASVTMASHYRGGGHTTYTQKKYCGTNYLKGQVEGLGHFLKGVTVDSHAPKSDEEAYRSLSDFQLEDIAMGQKIKPKKVIDAAGERHVYDREYIIAALVRHDRESNASEQSPAPHYSIHVENMNNSALMAGSPGSTINQHFDIRSEEFKNFVSGLRNTLAQVTLSDSDRDQASADLSTVEAQIGSPKPKHSVVRECMISVRTILENAAGSLIASGAIAAINHWFPV
jgi:hypothetical protein